MRQLAPGTVIIIAGSLIVSLSFGVRSIFGVVMDPISATYDWPREVFSMSLAIQNIFWGLGQPLFGWIADRFGDRRALWLGFVVYLVGMLMSAMGQTPLAQHMGAGMFVGFGIAGTAFGLVLSVVGRATPEARRSQALALTAAFGSLGQMIMPAVAGLMVESLGWQTTLLAFTAVLLPMAACIPFMRAGTPAGDTPDPGAASTRALLRTAFGHRSYLLLTVGFFVCGFHVAFISAHFPAFVAEMCATPDGPATELGALTLSIVGVANFIATLAVGRLGAIYPKPYILSAIYALRAVVILVFISMPVTPASVIVFSAVFGLLWLTTVPLTSGLVATMFGTRNMGTLWGFVFLSHQAGSFAGIYLGGRVYDLTGSYDLFWYVAIVLGVVSAIVHLPVEDRAWRPATATA
ncbi:MFS transporter [Limibaculum sp. M0105]|uniref:MFS transporter n=1 Tax=Thermohalobaculum xanthum TaxID=2753746 RepID=A0A8J7MAP0_9RHOB|nr:MFS transporter [Thermohalobaculum xanthum]MBK0400717.1 MFS transporter [Thermohalobaculum xanthum]